jgi:CMP-N-acetylneuraminic acid synthetase
MNRDGIIAIIPARGGSKGLPRKNVAMLGGQPLVAWSIQAARECALVGRTIVSTDDAEIRRVSEDCGAEVLTRPAELASDRARSQGVVRHVLERLERTGERPAHIVLLQATSPLRTAAHLESCLARFLASGAVSTVSVTEAEHHPSKMLRVVDGYLVPFLAEADLDAPRQLLPAVFRQNGAIYAIEREAFLRTDRFVVPPSLPFIMSAEDSVDIDSEADLRFAELLLAQRAHPTTARRALSSGGAE